MRFADNSPRAPGPKSALMPKSALGPKSLRAKLRRFIVDRSGATSIEYAVIASVMTAVVAAAMLVLGPAVSRLYDMIVEAFG